MQATLEETNASLRLLRDQLTAELATVDRQEENLLDLAADGTLATDKIRTRLTRLQDQRKEIKKRLVDSDERLTTGAAVLESQLNLLENPQALYQQLNDHGRRLLNQAMFEELLIDREEVTVQVIGQTYTEPVRDIMIAAHAYREQAVGEAPAYANRPTVDGEPARETLAGLLSPISLDGGWSRTAMVELVGRYSNPDECGRLVDIAQSAKHPAQAEAEDGRRCATPLANVLADCRSPRRARHPATLARQPLRND